MFLRFIQTTPDKGIILIRLMVGCVFLSEGIQKIVFSEILGAGRFGKIGLPAADFLADFVGVVEICCGLLIIIGLLTRLAAMPLIFIMFGAIAITKAEIYVEEGFWEMLHAGRTDWSMLLGSIFLFIKGGGFWSCDYILVQHKKSYA